MALSKRLFSIFSMVEKGSVVADIGCDHGLLSIALIEENICQHVYACDLREGPLSRAKQAIYDLHLEHQITTLLTNGMKQLPDGIDTIIIAGMGFETIQGILERSIENLAKYKRIIIQSNKHVDDVRRWISNHQYTILEEDIVEEDHFYEVIAFHTRHHEAYDEDQILFGTNPTHPLFDSYWKHRLAKIELVLKQLPKSESTYETFFNFQHRIKNMLETKRHSCK